MGNMRDRERIYYSLVNSPMTTSGKAWPDGSQEPADFIQISHVGSGF